MKSKQAFISFLLLLTIATLPGCDESKITGFQPSGLANGQISSTINGFVQSSNQLTLLAQALSRTGLNTLLESGTYTLIAPSDAAFRAYLNARRIPSVEAIPVDDLRNLLRRHIIQGKLLSPDAFSDTPKTFQPLFGAPLTILYLNNFNFNLLYTLRVNNIDIQTSNLQPTNGVIHVLKDNMIPL